MGPFDLLAEQHRELEERLAAIEASEGPRGTGSRRQQLAELASLLGVHARLEERHVSPLLTRVEGHVRAREESEDHLAMRELLEELEEFEPGDDEWWARFTALEDLVVSHVREEEAETFPRLSSALGEEEQGGLYRVLLDMREELVSGASALSESQRLNEEPRWGS